MSSQNNLHLQQNYFIYTTQQQQSTDKFKRLQTKNKIKQEDPLCKANTTLKQWGWFTTKPVKLEASLLES